MYIYIYIYIYIIYIYIYQYLCNYSSQKSAQSTYIVGKSKIHASESVHTRAM